MEEVDQKRTRLWRREEYFKEHQQKLSLIKQYYMYVNTNDRISLQEFKETINKTKIGKSTENGTLLDWIIEIITPIFKKRDSK